MMCKYKSHPDNAKMAFMRPFSRVICALATAIMLTFLTACSSSASVSTASDKSEIAWLQQSGNMTINFSAMMNFDVTGYPGSPSFTYPTQLAVPAVPITWMGTIFNGTVTDNGTGYTLTDEVHGSVSADGAWINEVTFSRKSFSQSGQISYSVTLVNVPISKPGTASTTLANFAKKGTDVRKFISKIAYTSGGSISTEYESTVWEDTNNVLNLTVDFAKGKGTRPSGMPLAGPGKM
jgi:hypothetical protein